MRPPHFTFALLLIAIGSHTQFLHADDKLVNKSTVEKIDVEKFDQKRQERDAVVLDVRTPKEFAEGHVPGAMNVDLNDPKFSQKVGDLDKSKTYLVHCASGVRSERAARKMAGMGFTNLFDFHGGFHAWKNAHKPIEKGDANSKDSAR